VSDASAFRIKELECGLTVVGQLMPGVQSAGIVFLIGAGAARDQAGSAGLAHLTESMLFRGTERLTNRQLTDRLDELGASRSSGTGIEVASLSSLCLGDRVEDVLDVFIDVARRPAFPQEDLEAVKQLQLQEIGQREDQPGSLCLDSARRMFFGDHPLANDVLGTSESVPDRSLQDLRHFAGRFYGANNVVLGIAGAFDWDQVLAKSESVTSGWETGDSRQVFESPTCNSKVMIENRELAQEHICFTFPGVPSEDSRFHAVSLMSLILGGGMNSRLFSEVREKRGLAYTVGARSDGFQNAGLVRVYAATQPERAAESVSVIRSELSRLEVEPVSQAELDRAKIRLKSRVIMGGESSINRAVAISRDWWFRGRLRTLGEISESIDRVTTGDIQHFAREVRIVENLGFVGIGPLSREDLGL
jgi:predicted Zn-dependent peptidase